MRQEEGGNIWVEASQDGWRDTLGVIHRRRLWLSAAGDDFRGADTLPGGPGQPFTVRLHLHPTVTASLLQAGAAAMVRPPSGGGWRVRATGGRIGLRARVYLCAPLRGSSLREMEGQSDLAALVGGAS